MADGMQEKDKDQLSCGQEMRGKLDALCLDVMNHDWGDAKRIQHFLKVSSLCTLIGRQEGLSEEELVLLEAVGYVHDIGIRVAMDLYGKQTWALQEELGPEPARELLTKHGFPAEMIDRICYLVGHHHTFTDIQGMDYQILVEADFLVNLYERGVNKEAVQKTYDEIFQTETGKKICEIMFLRERE